MRKAGICAKGIGGGNAGEPASRRGRAEVFDSGVFEVWPGYFVCQDSREAFVGQVEKVRVSMYIHTPVLSRALHH